MTEGLAVPDEVKALNAALAEAQGEFPPIKKSKTANTGAYSYSYAPLELILECVRPALAKHGLSIVQRLEQIGGSEPAIRTELRHSEGGVIGASFPIGERPPNPQQLGSLLTYLRRYAIVAMLGIAAEDDDDGHQAATAKPAPARKATPKVPEPGPKADPKPEPPEPLNPGQVELTFGKHKGKTIAEVAAEPDGRRYIGWFAHSEGGNAKIKEAALQFLHDDDDIPF